MIKPPVPPFKSQEFIAGSLSDQNLAARKKFLVQGAQQYVHHVASAISEWYRNLEPGRLALWFQSLEPKELIHWFIAMSEWLKTPQAITLGISWLVVYFVVYVLVAYKLGFGVRGVVAGSFAAAWQSYAYGAFTPLGGVFAFLTSMAMMGKIQSIAATTGAIVATVITAGVCVFVGVGRS